MEIPEFMWKELATALKTQTIIITLWLTSKMYKNVISAHTKIIKNTVDYRGSKIYPEKMEEHFH